MMVKALESSQSGYRILIPGPPAHMTSGSSLSNILAFLSVYD